MRTLLSDVRQAVRALAGTPGFTAVAVLILALGIGLNTAVFSLINLVLLRPLHGESRPGQLVAMYSFDRTRPNSYHAVSYPAYLDIASRNGVFSQVAGLSVSQVGLGEGEMTRRVFAFMTTSTFFPLFDVQPIKGRGFLPEEERPGANRTVVILSEEQWRRGGADPDILGKTIRINTQLFTVIGIAPRGFGGPTTLLTPAVWLPTGVYDLFSGSGFGQGNARPFADRAEQSLLLFARLRPGGTIESAAGPVNALAGNLEREFPGEHRHMGLQVGPISRTGIGDGPQNNADAYAMSLLLLGMTGVVLGVACMNLANMLLARSTSRRREIAVRMALGASRGAIIRQLLVEGFLLSLAGAACGLLLSSWALHAFGASVGSMSELMVTVDPRPDLRVLGVTLALAVAATVLFCLGPALQLLRTNVFSELKEGARAAVTGRHRYISLRHVLVVGQIACSLALLAAAGLFVAGAGRASKAEPGFSLDGSLVVSVDPAMARLDEQRTRDFYRRALDRIRATPAVASASLASVVPFGNFTETRRVRVVGQAVADEITDNQTGGASTNYGAGNAGGGSNDANGVASAFYVIGRDYFNTLRIPVLRGRTFTEAEESEASGPRVAVIDEPLARRLFKDGDSLGRHIYLPDPDPAVRAPIEVIGIVGKTRHNLFDEAPGPHLYVPFGQHYRPTMHFHARLNPSAGLGEAGVLERLRAQVQAADSTVPIVLSSNMTTFRDSSMGAWGVQVGARMFAAFGIVAAFLAVLGIYGVRAYLVARRAREIGIRMALGATRGDVLRMVLVEGMALVGVGLAIGVPLALGAGMVLKGLVYQGGSGNTAALAGAAGLLSATALLACYVPARRATRVEPTESLRTS